jgi:transposase
MKIENIEVETVTLHGPVHALHKVTEDVGLEFILGEYAPEILTLVYSHILRPESLNTITRAIRWIDTDEIGLELPGSRKRFERAMDDLEARMQYIEKELHETIDEHCSAHTLFYDVTDMYFYGRNFKGARGGDSSYLPQIGIGLAVESQYGLPLFHHLFDENEFDTERFPVILERLQEFSRDRCTLVVDREAATKKNILDALASQFSVIACLPLEGDELKQVAVKESQKMGPEHIVEVSSVFVHAREIKRKWAGIDVRMIICKNNPLRQQIHQNRYYEVEEALRRLKNGVKIRKGMEKYITEVDGTPQMDYDAVREREKFDGVSIIMTTTDIPKEEVVQKYFDTDIIEKSFQSLECTFSVVAIRHWLWRRVKAHIFVCYLAYLHLTWMGMLLRKNGISMSPVKALEELETVYNVEITDKKTGMSTTRTVSLTEEQEAIYKALNLL